MYEPPKKNPIKINRQVNMSINELQNYQVRQSPNVKINKFFDRRRNSKPSKGMASLSNSIINSNLKVHYDNFTSQMQNPSTQRKAKTR